MEAEQTQEEFERLEAEHQKSFEKKRHEYYGRTIIEQIKAADIFALASWGAFGPYTVGTMHNDLGGVKFSVRILPTQKHIVTITVNYLDLYNVEVGHVRANKYTVDDEQEDIFCGDLVPVLEDIFKHIYAKKRRS